MGHINQPEVKIDDIDNKKNNDIIEKKKEGIYSCIHMFFIYLFRKCMKSKKRNKYSYVLLFFMVSIFKI